jgi:rRNA maturation endonuclease Nob1
MTTSVLMTHTRGYLSEADLQVVKDYAIEAPWEWRIALEKLVEIAEKSDKAETAANEATASAEITKQAHMELQAAVKAASDKMLRYVEKLELGRQSGNLTKGDIDVIAKGVRQAFEELEKAAD